MLKNRMIIIFVCFFSVVGFRVSADTIHKEVANPQYQSKEELINLDEKLLLSFLAGRINIDHNSNIKLYVLVNFKEISPIYISFYYENANGTIYSGLKKDNLNGYTPGYIGDKNYDRFLSTLQEELKLYKNYLDQSKSSHYNQAFITANYKDSVVKDIRVEYQNVKGYVNVQKMHKQVERKLFGKKEIL